MTAYAPAPCLTKSAILWAIWILLFSIRVNFVIVRLFRVEKQCKMQTLFFKFFVETFSTTRVKLHKRTHGLVHDCSNSSALAMELLQSCTKPSFSLPYLDKYCFAVCNHCCIWHTFPVLIHTAYKTPPPYTSLQDLTWRRHNMKGHTALSLSLCE